MLQYLRYTLFIIPAIGLAVTSPPIIDAMLSLNTDLDTLNSLLVFQFGNLGINSLLISVVLWISDLAYSGFSLSIPFLGITLALFIFAFLLPYLIGWRRQRQLNELFLRNQQNWIRKMVTILEFSVESTFVSKLNRLYAEIEAGKNICNGTIITRIVEIDEQGKNSNNYPSLFEDDIRQKTTCIKYLNFLDNLQENLREIIAQFEVSAIKEDSKLIDIGHNYIQKYCAQIDEIAKEIEMEKSTKPVLWIVVSFILTPILSAIIASFGSLLSQTLIQILPQIAQASALAH